MIVKQLIGSVAALLIFFATNCLAYEMPIGIPAPYFDTALANPITTPIPAQPAGWPGQAVDGYYYIDNTASNATDSENNYGFPDKPRKTMPTTIEAGGVMEVRGGPYILSDEFILTMNGTASAPVYVYGINKPEVSGIKSKINGSYFIFDGFKLTASRLITTQSSYATIRNTEVSGPNKQNGAALGGHHIVFYNNDIHHHQGDDKHGITILKGSAYIWLLDNLLHHNGGDGIQFCHKCRKNPPEYIFIGRNTAYGNRENGIDLKYGSNIVISQNETYNHQAIKAGFEFCYDDHSGCTTGSSGSDGASIVVGSDGAPRNVWVIFNHVHDSGKGIRVEEAYDGVLLGNLIHDIDSTGIEFEKTGEGPHIVAFNTIYHAGKGIKGPRQKGSLKIDIENNIVSNISEKSLAIDENAADCKASNNLFYNDGKGITIQWHNAISSKKSGNAINRSVSGSDNLVGDPNFRNTKSKDFSTSTGGAGIDKANKRLVSLNERFRSLFGEDVTLLWDCSNQPRSSTGKDHDIGAFEYNGATATTPTQQ